MDINSGTVKPPKQSVVSEVDVPIKDGDNITPVLLMAIAEADEAEDLLELPTIIICGASTRCCRSAWSSKEGRSPAAKDGIFSASPSPNGLTRR